jgi:predicted RND superfamily exporter protein
MDLLAAWLFRWRYLIWAVVLAGSAMLLVQGRPVEFDQSVEGFFSPDHPALLDYQRAKRTFGSDDIVFVAYEDEQLWTPYGMGRVHALAKSVREHVAGVARVDALDQMPLPWRIDAAAETLAAESIVRQPLALARLLGGLVTVGAAVRGSADRPEAIAELRRRVCASPLFRNLLVDAEGRLTVLIVRLGASGETDFKRSVGELRRHADEFARAHGLGRAAVVGPPVLLADGFSRLEKDNQTLGYVAMAFMAVTMLCAVRSLWWAVLPLAAGGATWLVTQAVLNGAHLKLTLSAGLIIAQTVVLCMPAASHLAMHFREATRGGIDARTAARQTLVAVAAPIAWCALTAAAGYLALLSSTVRPVYQFGLTMAACNLLAGVATFALAAGAMCPPRVRDWLARWKSTPARPSDGVMSQPPGPSPQPSPRSGEREKSTSPAAEEVPDREVPGREVPGREVPGRGMSWITDWALRRPSSVLVMFALPSLVLAGGVAWLRFESNHIRMYKQSSRVWQDYRYVEQKLGGIGLVELVFPGPKDATEVATAWLHRMREVAARIAAIDRDLVTHVMSLADVLARDRTRAPGAPTATTAVNEDDVIQGKLRVLGSPVFGHVLADFWDRSSGQMRLLVRIRESAEAEQKERAFAAMLSITREKLGETAYLSGLSHLMQQITAAIIVTQFQSTAWSAAIIVVMLVVAMRGVRLAVLALLPTVLAVGFVLGAMGWLGVRIDLSTAFVASVATGLSVDDTFHCLLRWKRELAAGRAPLDALRASYAGTGPGVILSSSAVSLGFLAMVFSEFVPTANFGWLVATATLGSSIGNLMVLPACLAIGGGSVAGSPAQHRTS